MVLVEAGIQQPVAVGVTRQKVHGAVAGAAGGPSPLNTAFRSKPDDLPRRAALGPPRPEATVLGACVVRVSSARASSVRADPLVRARSLRAPSARGFLAPGSWWPGKAERVREGRGGRIGGGAAEGGRCLGSHTAGQD